MDQLIGYAVLATIVGAFLFYHLLLDWQQQEKVLGWFWIIMVLVVLPVGLILSYIQLGDPFAHF